VEGQLGLEPAIDRAKRGHSPAFPLFKIIGVAAFAPFKAAISLVLLRFVERSNLNAGSSAF
jgi:hypothetical protein